MRGDLGFPSLLGCTLVISCITYCKLAAALQVVFLSGSIFLVCLFAGALGAHMEGFFLGLLTIA